MAVSPVFEWVGSELERLTPLSLIEARGTVRLLLKKAGLEPGGVTAAQMEVVILRLMPAALERRGVENSETLCNDLATRVRDETEGRQAESTETAYDVFRRLGSRSRGKKP